ncbi:MAG: neutral zinc metallopeptidase [Bacteroidales bacterium]|nr:neutral zinc metallopeptidase [Bacteroidales bacterium]
MKLTGRRQSSNVDDRRSGGVGGKTSMGLGGLIVAGLIYLLMGGDLSSFLSDYASQAITIQSADGGSYSPTQEEEELAVFASQILAGTEDVWSAIFKNSGRTYRAPKLVLFTSRVNSGCGGATASTGPFYCSADQTVYIDLSFFTTMKRKIGADGDFAYAYVIAHEVGHHVQYLLGTLNQAYTKMNQLSETEANKISVRLELQADFYAGIWAHYDNKMFGSLEAGDVEEGMNVASKIGDDYLQKKAYGTTQPESFNHGTSAQRSRWLNKGISTGDLSQGDTFSIAYSSL